MSIVALILVQMNNGSINLNNVFQAMDTDESFVNIENTDSPQFFKKTEGYFPIQKINLIEFENYFSTNSIIIPFKEHIYGTILPSDMNQAFSIARFFQRLKKTQEVDTFVILAENHAMRGPYNIGLTKFGYETALGKIEPNIDYVESLMEKVDGFSIGSSYRAFYYEKDVNSFLPFIKKEFPDAKVVPVLVKEFTKKSDLKELTKRMTNLYDDNIVVISAGNFEQKLDGLARDFHEELNKTVLKSLDSNGFEQIDSNTKTNLASFFEYMKNLGAANSEIFQYLKSENESYYFVNYYLGELNDERNLTIMAFGDMMLGRYVRTLMEANGMDYIFENIHGEDSQFFEGADIIFGNLEGPIYGEGRKGGTSMVFGFNTDIAPFLKKYGFNLLMLANNHATDQGWVGRDTTIEALNSEGIGWCGHPSEADSDSVYYNQVGDKKYAFLCFHDVTYKLDDEAAVNLIKTVRPNVDYLIVSAHWGYEYKHSANWDKQIDPAHNFIDAGADFVIGHHPHVVQNFEIYNARGIFYSLGNFIFDQYWSVATQEELAIGIVLDDNNENLKTKVYLFPMKSERSQPKLMTGAERDNWIEKFIGYGNYSDEIKEQIRNGILEW